MIIPVLAVLIVATVPLFGGRLHRLQQLRLRDGWLVLLALAVQVWFTTLVLDLPVPVAASLHLATYVMAFVFFWRNRHVPGLWVVGVGGFANFAAIAANAGTMPARPAAVEAAGLVLRDDFTNSGVVADPALWFLGDVFAIPAGWPLANVFSVGDVVLLVGLAVLVHRTCRADAADGAPAATPAASPADHALSAGVAAAQPLADQ